MTSGRSTSRWRQSSFDGFDSAGHRQNLTTRLWDPLILWFVLLCLCQLAEQTNYCVNLSGCHTIRMNWWSWHSFYGTVVLIPNKRIPVRVLFTAVLKWRLTFLKLRLSGYHHLNSYFFKIDREMRHFYPVRIVFKEHQFYLNPDKKSEHSLHVPVYLTYISLAFVV